MYRANHRQLTSLLTRFIALEHLETINYAARTAGYTPITREVWLGTDIQYYCKEILIRSRIRFAPRADLA